MQTQNMYGKYGGQSFGTTAAIFCLRNGRNSGKNQCFSYQDSYFGAALTNYCLRIS